MSDQSLEFEEYFTPGQSVRIALIAETRNLPEIPASAVSLDGDLLKLTIHEAWPDAVSIDDSGYLVELRSAHLGSAFRCRALLVSDTDEAVISVRLVGNIIFEELREYFRIDTYLPLRYYPMPGKDDKTVLRLWMDLTESREQRISGSTGFTFRGRVDTTASRYSPDAAPLEYSTPVAANISGGGLRTNLPEQLPPGCKTVLELYLPSHPPQIIDIIGEVLSSAYIRSDDGGKTFSTPFKFIHMPEQDRDAIIRHIHAVQQRQIRQIAEELPFDEQATDQVNRQTDRRRIALRIVSILIALLVAAFLFNLYLNRDKSEVAIIFEKGLKQYLDKMSPDK